MTDNELYQQILGLAAPWAVRSVKLNVQEERIDVLVEHARGTLFECPECGRQLSCHDHVAERQWRHLQNSQQLGQHPAKEPKISTVTIRSLMRPQFGR